MHKCETTL